MNHKPNPAAAHGSGLWPRPQKVEILDGFCRVPDQPCYFLPSRHAGLRRMARLVSNMLSDWAARARDRDEHARGSRGSEPFLVLDIDRASIPYLQGYRLAAQPSRIHLTGADEAGLFYGLQTLLGWLRLHIDNPGYSEAGSLRRVFIEDRPDFEQRGVMLDISRDKVPTMDSLFTLVDQLAGWHINQFQLYMEHTFAYEGHASVWRAADPMTGEQIRALDKFCRERFIALVPNQNSLGHFHRWLAHPKYRPLAECPEGVEHVFSLEREPFSLCPLDPGALALLEDLYGQLLPHFSAGMINVGLDETFDLGMGRSREVCEKRGKSRVYLDFLSQVHGLAARHGRTIQFWGDIVLEHPESIPMLPRDAIALEWGYEADHPFEQHCRALAESGLSFYVCPGTSAWFSIAGRTHNALRNLARAARQGKDAGAAGYLITDWGDFGHLQPAPVSMPGFLAGAGFAWNASSATDLERLDAASLLDQHAFGEEGRGLGRCTMSLGNAYRQTGFTPANGSALFFLLRYPDQPMSHERLRGLTPEGLQRAENAVQRALAEMAGSKANRNEDDRVERELRWAGGMLRWCCRFGIARLSQGGSLHAGEIRAPLRRVLGRDLRSLLAEHRTIWLLRNRPGGLADSCRKLERVHDQLQ